MHAKQNFVAIFLVPILIVVALLIFGNNPDAAINHGELAKRGWNNYNYTKITKWLDGLKTRHVEQLIVLLDCDNTAWAGDIADSMFLAGVDHGLISWDNAPILSGYSFDQDKTTPFDYYEHLYRRDPVVAYNYVAKAFAGLSLRDAFKIFELAQRRTDFPTAYRDLKELLDRLSSRGITVGFVSASPIFMVAPMLQLSEYTAPLPNVEGIDVYVRKSGEADEEALLSNLIHSAGLTSWDEVLESFGDMIITSRVSEIVNSREGKAIGGISIASRHVAKWNKEHNADNKLTFNQLKLAAVFGDNFGPFSDLVNSNPLERGNDQGLIRALPFIKKGGLVVDIHCGNSKDKLNNFLALAQQSPILASDLDFLVQVGICKGEGRGNFLPESI